MLHCKIEQIYNVGDWFSTSEVYFEDKSELEEFLEDSVFWDLPIDEVEFEAGYVKEMDTGGDWDDPQAFRLTLTGLNERYAVLYYQKKGIQEEIERVLIALEKE